MRIEVRGAQYQRSKRFVEVDRPRGQAFAIECRAFEAERSQLRSLKQDSEQVAFPDQHRSDDHMVTLRVN